MWLTGLHNLYYVYINYWKLICFSLFPFTASKAKPGKAKLKAAFTKGSEEEDEIVLDISNFMEEKKPDVKAFRCLIGDKWQIRVTPAFYGRTYISIREWEKDEKGAERVGKGITLPIKFMEKLVAGIGAANKHCIKYELISNV